jgi:hypothetical protein
MGFIDTSVLIPLEVGMGSAILEPDGLSTSCYQDHE